MHSTATALLEAIRSMTGYSGYSFVYQHIVLTGIVEKGCRNRFLSFFSATLDVSIYTCIYSYICQTHLNDLTRLVWIRCNYEEELIFQYGLEANNSDCDDSTQQIFLVVFYICRNGDDCLDYPRLHMYTDAERHDAPYGRAFIFWVSDEIDMVDREKNFGGKAKNEYATIRRYQGCPVQFTREALNSCILKVRLYTYYFNHKYTNTDP